MAFVLSEETRKGSVGAERHEGGYGSFDCICGLGAVIRGRLGDAEYYGSAVVCWEDAHGGTNFWRDGWVRSVHSHLEPQEIPLRMVIENVKVLKRVWGDKRSDWEHHFRDRFLSRVTIWDVVIWMFDHRHASFAEVAAWEESIGA